MKVKLVKRLHEIMLEIIKANDEELIKIGVELAEIEKKLMAYQPRQNKE
jgi:hypothetical protein